MEECKYSIIIQDDEHIALKITKDYYKKNKSKIFKGIIFFIILDLFLILLEAFGPDNIDCLPAIMMFIILTILLLIIYQNFSNKKLIKDIIKVKNLRKISSITYEFYDDYIYHKKEAEEFCLEGKIKYSFIKSINIIDESFSYVLLKDNSFIPLENKKALFNFIKEKYN